MFKMKPTTQCLHLFNRLPRLHIKNLSVYNEVTFLCSWFRLRGVGICAGHRCNQPIV